MKKTLLAALAIVSFAGFAHANQEAANVEPQAEVVATEEAATPADAEKVEVVAAEEAAPTEAN